VGALMFDHSFVDNYDWVCFREYSRHVPPTERRLKKR
jgi:hypothetical protein